MACHEIAALRLALMEVLGQDDSAERAHELAELGDAVSKPGPVQALHKAKDLDSIKKFFEASLSELHNRVADAADSDPKLPYWRSLMVLTKKVELELQHHVDSLTRFYRDLDEMHDFVHEIYPAS